MFYSKISLVAYTTLSALGLTLSAKAVTVDIGQNFTGSTLFVDSVFIPPDTMGAVGEEHFVELINGRYSVYSKSQVKRVQTSSLDDFWVNAGATPKKYAFNPRVLYDPTSKRWFALSVDNMGAANNFLLAISNSSDPTQGWKGFAIASDTNNSRWADYPALGVTGDGAYLAANMFPLSASFAVAVVSIPKADLLSPTPTVKNGTLFSDLKFSSLGFSLQPIVDFAGFKGEQSFLATDFFDSSVLRHTKKLDYGDLPSLQETTSISVTKYTKPPVAIQPNGQYLEVIDARLSSSVCGVGDSLWAVHSVNVNSRSAIRWYEISKKNNTVLQSGTISDPYHDYFSPSIAVNSFGNVAIAFNRSGEGEFVSSYAVVGETKNGVTSLSEPILLKAGVANYFQDYGTGRNRWGNYSATTLDPKNPFSFWTIQEYVSAPDTWSTQITEIRIKRPNRTVSESSFVFGLFVFGLVVGLANTPPQRSGG